MTAETVIATRAAATFPVHQSHVSGTMSCAYGTYAVSAAVEDGDIFQMCKVPKGATVVGGYFHAEDLDTGGEAIDFMLGWAANGTDAADPNGLLLATVMTGDISVHLDIASTWMPLQGVMTATGPKTFAAETTIQAEVNTAATTFAAGQISLIVYYIQS